MPLFRAILIICCFLLPCVSEAQSKDNAYQCLPCGASCDSVMHAGPGTCDRCHMELVKRSTVRFKIVQPSALQAYLKAHPEVVLLDVRTPEEFSGNAVPNYGTLPGAINIPVGELARRIGELESYKQRPILVFCSHSHRSPRAAWILGQHGFRDVTNLSGGMSAVK